MSCSLVRWAIIASVLTRPRNAAAKSGAEIGFIEFTEFESHPPVANSRAATAVRIGVDLLIIAPQVRRPRRRAPSTGGFSGIVESQIRLDRGARSRGMRPQQVGDRVDHKQTVGT